MEEKSKTKSRRDFWKQIGIIIIGTTISLVLTIGSSQFLEMRQRAKDRRLTAMMVLSNFESSAKAFEDMSKKMAYADSVGAWLLAQPIEKLELMPDDELQRLISDVTVLKVFFHDETAEKIFSNNIDTWKNMGNFQFVDRVGQCFALVKTGENYWSDWVLEVDDVTKEIKAHTNDYEGKNYMIKCLRNDNVRSKIARLHKFRGWLNYTAAVIRYNNRINMACIGISEDEVMAFTKEREKEVQYEGQVPNAYDYYTPDLDPDSLITLKRFNEMIEK